MATPFGHGLLGIASARLVFGRRPVSGHAWWVVTAAGGIAADLDFLPGILAGDVNRFHQGASHSLLSAALFGLGVGIAARIRAGGMHAWRLGLASALAYASHLALDLFADDRRAPIGIPLFWPFSGRHVHAGWAPLSGVRHGSPGDSYLTVALEVFSLQNLWTVAVECLLFAPVLAAVLLVLRPSWGRRSRPHS